MRVRESVVGDPHGTILDFTDKCNQYGIQRFYPAVSAGVWFPNDFRDWMVNRIVREVETNPDFVLFDARDKEVMYEEFSNSKMERPYSTEDFVIGGRCPKRYVLRVLSKRLRRKFGLH